MHIIRVTDETLLSMSYNGMEWEEVENTVSNQPEPNAHLDNQATVEAKADERSNEPVLTEFFVQALVRIDASCVFDGTQQTREVYSDLAKGLIQSLKDSGFTFTHKAPDA